MEYENLTNLLVLLACDNGLMGNVREPRDWPSYINYNCLEAQASRMTRAQKILFIEGEQTEAEALVDELKLQVLHQFLNDVFHGCFPIDYFYKTY